MKEGVEEDPEKRESIAGSACGDRYHGVCRLADTARHGERGREKKRATKNALLSLPLGAARFAATGDPARARARQEEGARQREIVSATTLATFPTMRTRVRRGTDWLAPRDLGPCVSATCFARMLPLLLSPPPPVYATPAITRGVILGSCLVAAPYGGATGP